MNHYIGLAALFLTIASPGVSAMLRAEEPVTLNQKADGYRGIWYMNQPSGDEYVYKYSGATADDSRKFFSRS